jgi:hypothetical protein
LPLTFYFQVYTAQRVEYSGGSFYGNENEEPTKTLLSFLISSVCGSYEDLVCFIPIVTLTWEILLAHFLKVLEALTKIGFQVLPVLADGHKTNARFFKELGKGELKVSVRHPFNPDWPLYLLFDPVHLMKNFYNNFERHKYF